MALEGGAWQYRVTHRQAGFGHGQGQEHLAFLELGVFAVARLLEFIFAERLEVQGGAIEEQHAHGAAQQGLGLVTGQGVQLLDTCLIQQVHHAVDLGQRHLHAEVGVQGAYAGPFAVRVGQARHDAVAQGLVGGPVAPGRQQPVQAQGFVHGAVHRMDAADEALGLLQLLEVHLERGLILLTLGRR